MNTKKSKNPPQIFFFNEALYNRAIGELKGYCTSANKIISILKEHDFVITPETAKESITASIDVLSQKIMDVRRKSVSDMPKALQPQMVTPELNKIETIKNGMANMGAYNAGFIPSEYLQFEKDKFVADEKRLKEFFTIYRNETLTEIERLAKEFIEAWEKLKNNSAVQTFDNIINVYGIINLDLYSQSFTFNIKSPDLTTLPD